MGGKIPRLGYLAPPGVKIPRAGGGGKIPQGIFTPGGQAAQGGKINCYTGLSLTWSKTTKTGFLMMRLKSKGERDHLSICYFYEDQFLIITSGVHWVTKISLRLVLPNERTAKTLIRLGGCPGWSESSLNAQSF